MQNKIFFTFRCVKPLSALLFFLLILVVFNGKLASKTLAQEVSFTVSPSNIFITSNHPADINTPITITNTSDAPLILSVAYRSFEANEEENGQVLYYSDTFAHPGKNVNFFEGLSILDGTQNLSVITLSPKQKKTVTFHIDLAASENTSDYYFSILFVSSPAVKNPLPTLTSSYLSAIIATNVILSISPSKEASVVLEEFSTTPFITHGPVDFRIRVQNASDHVLKPQGVITVTNMFGQTIGKIDLDSSLILSHSLRSLTNSDQDSKNSFKSEKVLSKTIKDILPHAVWPEEFLLGPYTANLTLKIPPNGPVIQKTTYFLALPIPLLVGLLISLVILIVVKNRVSKKMS